jgi:ubiquinone/menaquinone biosynthesis C-methylase UbiE
MLPRVLEPEVMESLEEALDYDSMDHRAVNEAFATDFLRAFSQRQPAPRSAPAGGLPPDEGRPWLEDILDLGTGTAQIPIEICRLAASTGVDDFRVTAVDLAIPMLDLARANVEVAGLTARIRIDRVDAKSLPFADRYFAAVISNSIVHHIPQPAQVLREAVRVTAVSGLVFVRDLARPPDDASVRHLVDAYAGDATAHQRKMFEDSLRAALDIDEMRALVEALGYPPESVQMTSDRHWTWCASKPAPAASIAQGSPP